ncbi:MAG: DNA photolyase family protein [Gemmataceae bacterium]|nr:DNA photolyase family protein [Gemmataceae bacterium]
MARSQEASLVLFRLDLRLADNPALAAAAKRGGPLVPVFTWCPEEEGAWPTGSASRWWLHQSLAALDASLRKLGSRLVRVIGPTLPTVLGLARETGAGAVFWNRRYEPALVARDTALKAGLRAEGLVAESSNSALLAEPWTLRTKQDRPFQVFMPFWKAMRAAGPPGLPLPAPTALPAPGKWPASAELGLEPTLPWAARMAAHWTPGEAGAAARLDAFLPRLLAYHEDRDRPAFDGTSSLSPHLHFGEIGPRQVWHAVRDAFPRTLPTGPETFLKELAWREFAHHLLHCFPHTPEQPLREDFARFPWRTDAAALRAWQRGRTGYPLVDAGMRQLWAVGWMHNRVRMVAASFLVKHLLLPWQEGARWFWDTLADADLANNTLGWQWTAGCGADAAPYFRIFNPVVQGERYDPEGEYVRRWVRELAGVPARWVHQPWNAPAEHRPAGYPAPIVEHGAARERALAALASMSAT